MQRNTCFSQRMQSSADCTFIRISLFARTVRVASRTRATISQNEEAVSPMFVDRERVLFFHDRNDPFLSMRKSSWHVFLKKRIHDNVLTVHDWRTIYSRSLKEARISFACSSWREHSFVSFLFFKWKISILYVCERICQWGTLVCSKETRRKNEETKEKTNERINSIILWNCENERFGVGHECVSESAKKESERKRKNENEDVSMHYYLCIMQ